MIDYVQDLIVGVLASVVGGVILLLFSCFYRRYNAESSRRHRQKRVRVFIDAVRGEVGARQLRVLLGYRLILPVVGILVLVMVNSCFRAEQEHYRQTLNPTETETDDQIAEENPVNSVVTARRGHSAQRIEDLQKAIVAIWCCAGALVLFICRQIVNNFWIEYQTTYAYKLARFANRMQGLASKAELAELTKLELAVRDEETARAYVDKMSEIAHRQKLPELVEPFLFWNE